MIEYVSVVIDTLLYIYDEGVAAARVGLFFSVIETRTLISKEPIQIIRNLSINGNNMSIITDRYVMMPIDTILTSHNIIYV